MSFSTFFSKIQEANWYRQFLNPVIEAVPANSKFLDIGTGTGKLLEILVTEKNVDCIGIDTNQEMLDEAKKKLGNIKTQLIKIKADENLPFENEQFDTIAICSVLFHLKKEAMFELLDETQRVLTKNGKIIVLTPTGRGGLLKLSTNFFSLSNRSIYVWYSATKKRARLWSQNKYLREYCDNNDLQYKQKIELEGFSLVETIEV